MKYIYLFIAMFIIIFHNYNKVFAQGLYPDVKLSGINIVPPVVFAATINKSEIKDMEDSLFDTKIYDYVESPYGVDGLTKKCYKHYHKFFKKTKCSFLPSFNKNDSIIYRNELKKLLDGVKPDFNYKTIQISDTLKELLSKYPGDQFLLTYISFYGYSTTNARGGSRTDYLSIQCIIVDNKIGSVIFYNYKTWCDAVGNFVWPHFQKVLQDLKL